MNGSIRSLVSTDQHRITSWARAYLTAHLRIWSKAYNLAWSAEMIAQHIDTHRLDHDLWSELCDDVQRPEEAYVGVCQAVNDTTPLGVIHIQTRMDPYLRMRVGCLSWIFVDESSRGRGVADALMRSADAWLRAHHLPCTEVFATSDNPRAVGLYARHGFSSVDVRMLRGVGS